MADISMNYAALESAASKITSAESELDSLISKLTSVIDTLGDGYQGQSYQAFKNAWEESKPTMTRIKEAVGAFAPALNEAATKQQELEGETGGKMGGLGFN